MIPVLGIPHLNRPDLLSRCLRSIDFPVERLVIVQNGPDELMPWEDVKLAGAEVFKHPNAGVGGSWNEVMMLCPAPWWMLTGNDIQFAPGDLQKLATAAWSHQFEYAILFGNHGHSLFAQTKRGTRRVGLYDWNIYPAYCEDCEWMWRMNCAGEKALNVEGIQAIHGEMVDGKMHGSRTVNSDPNLRGQNARTHGNNFAYYREKTGGMPGEEKFQHPFNNPHIPLTYLAYDPDVRERNSWK